MATSAESDVMCGVCEAQSGKSQAVKWCPECQESFCLECLKYHSSSRFTKRHMIIDTADMKKLPKFLLKIKNFCVEHEEPYQNYCKNHDNPCCSKCIDTKHGSCKGMPALGDVIKGSASSAALTDVEDRLKRLTDYYNDLLNQNQNNMKDIQGENEAILSEIKTIRSTLNKHLDKLEDDILVKLYDTQINCQKVLQETASSLKEMEKKTVEILDGINTMKKYASDLQIFLGTKKLEEEIRKDEEKIEELVQKGKMNLQKLVFEQNSKLDIILSEFKTFGTISVSSIQPKPCPFKQNCQQAPVTSSASITTWTFNFHNYFSRK